MTEEFNPGGHLRPKPPVLSAQERRSVVYGRPDDDEVFIPLRGPRPGLLVRESLRRLGCTCKCTCGGENGDK